MKRDPNYIVASIDDFLNDRIINLHLYHIKKRIGQMCSSFCYSSFIFELLMLLRLATGTAGAISAYRISTIILFLYYLLHCYGMGLLKLLKTQIFKIRAKIGKKTLDNVSHD